MHPERIAHLSHFYDILNRLEVRTGGKRNLAMCSARSGWPQLGVYFFFENGETRSDSGSGPRVVRVGTHAVTNGAHTQLWDRLAQHKGTRDLGGNNRGSVFRRLVGHALAAKDSHLSVPTWGQGKYSLNIRNAERNLEMEVSRYIGNMPLLWISIEDPASANSRRAYIERNAIALLSNASVAYDRSLDLPSNSWLGLQCPHPDVQRSGLWNSRHVSESYDPAFLEELERYLS
jgi:hypothetical protein